MSPESEELAERIRSLIGHKPGVIEKRMFGGFGFMLNGNMVAGSMSTGEILLRADPERIDEALSLPGAAAMKMGERTMTGFYTVDYDAIANDDDLKIWVDRSWAYVKTMPPKAEKPTTKKAIARKSIEKKASAKKPAAEASAQTTRAKAPAKKAAAKKVPAKKPARMAR